MSARRQIGYRRSRRIHRGRRPAVEHLESRLLLSAQPIINEILARNNGVIQDEDGDFSDYVELYNRGDAPVNLDGWYLTDDASELTKWRFPAVELPAGAYLVVFASGKDRVVAGSSLHASFGLSAAGEFVALVEPNGMVVASQFAPQYPPQYEDVSYGVAVDAAEAALIETGDAAQIRIPADGSLGTAWTAPTFTPDASWQAGSLGVGYSAGDQPVVSTTVLQVDFNDRDSPVNTQPGFSPFVVNGSGIQAATVTRSFGPIQVTLMDASGAGYDDRIRGTPTNGGDFSETMLLQDFVFSRDNTGTGGLDVVIDGLAPAQTYTLTVWSFDTGSAGLRTSDWTANGIAIADYSFDGAAPPTSNDTYKFGFVVAADTQGRIVLQGRKDESTNNFAVFLNALRLETGDTLNPPAGAANVLRVDFNDRTDGEVGAANTEPGYAVMTLDENNSTFDGVKLTLSAYGATTLDDRDRTGPVDAGAFTLDQLYDDLIYAVGGGAGTGMEILIEGLVPNASYDVLLRSYDDLVSNTRQSIWTEESSGQSVVIASPYNLSGSVAPTTNDDHAMRAELVSSPQGTLLLRGVQVGTDRSVMINALELTRASFSALVGTDIESTMLGQNSSAYIRVPFSVPDVSAVHQLLLDMYYDAGFVAYLNGQEVARRNAPTAAGLPPSFNAAATAERANSAALYPDAIDLTLFKHLLFQGAGNVLAIHGLNSAPGDSDFLIAPQLRAIQSSGEALRYFETPTPGAANAAGVIDFVLAVEPSVGHGFFDAPFSLTLASPTPGATIYYTFDGSGPSPGNAAAFEYAGPVLVNRTTALRAAAVKAGYADSPITTETYIFLDDVVAQSINPSNSANNPFDLAYPSVWQANASGDYNMDPDIVAQWDDDNPANQDFGIREALMSLPTMSIVLPHSDLWNAATGIYPNAVNEGAAWRRAGSIEYINPSTGEQFQYNVGVQMHGSASRDNVRLKKHSFRLVFNSEFDGPGRLDFPLFEDSDFADINTVVLKASFTDSFATRTQTGRYSPLDSTYTRDVSMLDSQRAMGSLAPNATYVHLYINGLYWGVYYPTERVDDAYLASHVGGDRDDWDIIRDFNELYRGTTDVWNAMFALVNQLPGKSDAQADAIFQQLQGRNPDGTLNPALPAYLDMDNFIDYMVLHLYAGVEDWPSHNWVAARNRVDPGLGFQFFTWDQEISWDGRYRDRTNVSNTFTPAEIYDHLRRESPEFRLRFADRVAKQMFNDGALTVAATQQRWQARADQVEAAIIAESARWGDAREGEVVNVPPTTTIPVMTVNHWRNSIDAVRDQYIPQSHPLTISRLTAIGLFPSVAAPQFSQFGGVVPSDFPLTLSTTSAGATIWYTANGADPRLPGGAINASAAMPYAGNPVPVSGGSTIRARSLVAGQWSALTEASFVSDASDLRITELHYNPAEYPGVADRQDAEFIELLNTGSKTIRLSGVQIAGFADPYTFASDATLGPGERMIVARNPAVFEFVYGSGFNVAQPGYGPGNLSNAGEQVTLLGTSGEVLQDILFGDEAPWPTAPDGAGPSLEIIDPLGDAADPANWRASTYAGGSPGASGVAGDFDGNGAVDDADGIYWRAHYGATAARGTGADGNRDGLVNAADYVVWRNQFAAGAAAGTPAVLGAAVAASATNSDDDGSSFDAANSNAAATDRAMAVLFADTVPRIAISRLSPLRRAAYLVAQRRSDLLLADATRDFRPSSRNGALRADDLPLIPEPASVSTDPAGALLAALGAGL